MIFNFPAVLFSMLTPLFFPSCISSSYSCSFHARVFGKTLVHEFTFSIATLNGTYLFPTAQPPVHNKCIRSGSVNTGG